MERGRDVEIDGVVYPAYRVRARDNEHAVEVFNALARVDVDDAAIQELAGRFLRCARDMLPAAREDYLARRIHRHVRDFVAFIREEEEIARPPGLTFALSGGDCDEHGAMVCALAWACGLRARAVAVRDPCGDITHLCAVLAIGGRSYWAETTVAADFGEHPRHAARRLGLYDRKDVVG